MADSPSGSSDTSGNPYEDDLTSEEEISSTPSTPSSVGQNVRVDEPDSSKDGTSSTSTKDEISLTPSTPSSVGQNARVDEPDSSKDGTSSTATKDEISLTPSTPSSVGMNTRVDEPDSSMTSEDEISSTATKGSISSPPSSFGENVRIDEPDSSSEDGTSTTPLSTPTSPPRALTPPLTPPPGAVAAPPCNSCRRALNFSPPDQITPESDEDGVQEGGPLPESGEDEAAIYDELTALCDPRLLLDLQENVPGNQEIASHPVQFEPPENPQLRGVFDHLSEYLDCFARARALLGLGLIDLEKSARLVRWHIGTKTAKRLYREMLDRAREIDAMLQMYRTLQEILQLLTEKRTRMEAVIQVLSKRTEAFRKRAGAVLASIEFVEEEVRKYLGSVGDSEANVCVLLEKLETLRGEVPFHSLKDFKWSMEIAMIGLVMLRRQKRQLLNKLKVLVQEKNKFRKVLNAYLRDKRIARSKMAALGDEIEALVAKVGRAMDALSTEVIFPKQS